MGDCPEEYLEFFNAENDYRANWEENTRTIPSYHCNHRIDLKKDRYDKLKAGEEITLKKKDLHRLGFVQKDDKVEISCDNQDQIHAEVVSTDDSAETAQIKLIEPPVVKNLHDYYGTFEKYMEGMGYDYNEEEGAFGYYTNPNSKWDWYSVGGRWTGFFKLKPGKEGVLGQPGVFHDGPCDDPTRADMALKGDIDFDAMREEYRESARKRWASYQELGQQYPFSRRIPEGETLAEYVEKNSYVTTYAFLKDGNWVGQGDMGWFGMSSNDEDDNDWNKRFNDMLMSLPDDTILTVVDCHV